MIQLILEKFCMGIAFILNILIWLLLWTVPWLTFFWYLNKHNINYVDNYWITTLSFFIISVFIIVLFYPYFAPFIRHFTIIPFYFLILFYTIAFLTYFLSRKLFAPSIAYWKQQQKVFSFSILMNYRFLLSKSFEILFQQITVVLLLSFLLQARLKLINLIYVFTAIFGISHIPAVIVKKHNVVWYAVFTLASFLSGIIFPVLITTVHYGFVYTYIIHWFFYILTGVLINIRKRNELNNLAI